MCAAHSDLHSVALLRLLSFPLSVPQLGLRLLQAPLGDFPECVDLVPLQLEVAPLLPFPVQLLSEANDVLLQLEVHRHVCQFELKIDDVSTELANQNSCPDSRLLVCTYLLFSYINK